MKKDTYERACLEITEFENEDVIATSGLPQSPSLHQQSLDHYEGRGFLQNGHLPFD